MEQLTNEMLISRIKSGSGNMQEDIERLWTKNRKLIRFLIRKLTGINEHEQDFEDMEQQAFIGMLEAVYKFSNAENVKFFSYAEIHIRKSIYKYYNNNGFYIRIPSYMKTRIKKYKEVKERIERAERRKVSDDEIRENMHISIDAYNTMLDAINCLKVLSVDQYIATSGKDGETTVVDMIAGGEDTESIAIESVYYKELHETICKALSGITDTERRIISAHYFQGYPIARIAERMGREPQTVRNHISTAFRKMRTGRHGKKLASFLPERAAIKAARTAKAELEEITEEEKELLIL